jgi:hypothetical protein
MPVSARALRNLMPLRILATLAGAVLSIALAQAMPVSGDTLRSRYAELLPRLEASAWGEPVVLESRETEGSAEGDVWAVLDHGFPATAEALTSPASWCEILILHVNVKYCRPSGDAASPTLVVNVGRRFEQPLDDTSRIEFSWTAERGGPDYFSAALAAAQGPLGTEDYRIAVEAIPVPPRNTFLHLRYSYRFGAAARLATRAYLATAGRDLVGFTVVGRDEDGGPRYIRGVLAALERNAMRYYLAVDAFVATLDAPRAAQFDERIRRWAEGVGRYPRQLPDFDAGAYFEMKTSEHQRQLSEPVDATGP